MIHKLQEIENRFIKIEQELQKPEVATDPSKLQSLGKMYAELEPTVQYLREYKKTETQLNEAKELLNDPEMKDLAQEEITGLESRLIELEESLKARLVPKDPLDEKSVIIEIRPAAGGSEAGLFAAEMYRTYTRYAERRKWKYEVIDYEDTGIGGASRVVFSIDAKGAYSQLKYESGVHRVQRVPATESGGRVHTSTITIAVLPEAEEVDVEVNEDDLEISTFRASSAGGQHVQKNETAIRIIHKPTGLVVTCQDERSQAQNKLRGIQVLRTKLYQAELEKAQNERSSMRRGQIGTGDRSEKIRTYNFPQSRITDHRIGVSVHNILTFMDGDMQNLIDELVKAEIAQKVADASE